MADETIKQPRGHGAGGADVVDVDWVGAYAVGGSLGRRRRFYLVIRRVLICMRLQVERWKSKAD